MDLVESAITKTNSRHPWEKARLKVVIDLIKKQLNYSTDEKLEVLDIGCGDVWLIENLSETFENAHFTAVDTAFTPEILEQYRESLPADKFSLGADLKISLKERNKKIDLILLLDVIEHIEDEIDFLKQLSKLSQIDSSTVFLITVPAYQDLFCSHDTFLGHYRRYTNKSLKNRLEKAGLKARRTGYFFSSLILPRALIKLAETSGLKSKKAKGIGDYQAKAIDGLIENTLYTDYQISKSLRSLGLKLGGLSNYAIASFRADN